VSGKQPAKLAPEGVALLLASFAVGPVGWFPPARGARTSRGAAVDSLYNPTTVRPRSLALTNQNRLQQEKKEE
jgi:parvulin-like peptidyl-prolyl isomerase